jgi:preprotein translocase subunit SecE
MAAVEKLRETRTFIEECWVELTKVTWPDMDQLRSATIVVVLFTIAISAVIWLMDKAASWVITLIMGIFGAA